MLSLLLALVGTVAAQDDLNISIFPNIIDAHLVPNIDLPEEEIATRVLIEFESGVDGIGNTSFADEVELLCSDLFDFFDEFNGTALTERNNCRFCFEQSDDNNFALIVIPDILDDFDNRVFRDLQDEEKDPAFDESTRFIQIRGQAGDSAVPIIRLPDFQLVDAVETRTKQFALVYNLPVHFVRGFPGRTDEFTTFCFNVFTAEDPDSLGDCTFTFVDNVVFVTYTGEFNGVVTFDTNNPSIFSIEDKYGLKPAEDITSKLRPRPVLDITEHNFGDGSVTMIFKSDLNGVDVVSIQCSLILSFSIVNENTDVVLAELFGERPDLSCSIRFDDNLKDRLRVEFPDFVPFFPTLDGPGLTSRFDFVDSVIGTPGFFGPDGLQVPINEDTKFTADPLTYEGIEFSIVGPRQLTECDTIFILEVSQIRGVFLPTILEISEIENVLPPVEEFSLTEACDIFSTTIVCNTTDLADSIDFTVTYNFVLEAKALFSNANPEFNLNVSTTEPFAVVQDFGVQKIPISVSGVDLFVGVQVQRGNPLFFTAVLGDVFGCAGVNETVPVTFSWDIFDENGEVVVSRNSKIFSAGGAEVPVGTFDVVLAADANLSRVESNSIDFTLEVFPVEVVLVSRFGQAQTVSTEEPAVTLDASRSCNPNVVNEECQNGLGFVNIADLNEIDDDDEQIAALGFENFALAWSCSNCGELEEEVFQDVNRSLPVIDIPIDNFVSFNDTNDLVFVFEAVNLQNVNDRQALQVNVNLVEPPEQCFIPTVEITPVDPKVNVNGAVSITSNVVAPVFDIFPGTFQWIEEVANGDPVFADNPAALQRSSLFIPANTLSEGATYTYTVIATPDCADGDPTVFGSASASFATNRRPVGGTVLVDPIEGDTLTPFTITTAGWVDPDGDNPLQFSFELIYLTDDELANINEISATDTIPLSQFSQSLSIVTNLQIPPEGTRTVIIAVARDSLGAVSRRVLLNTNSEVIVQNGFVEAADVNLDEINALIEDLINTGDRTQIPNLCSAITSALNELDPEIVEEIGEEVLIEVRRVCFDAVTELLDENIVNGEVAVDADVVNLVASSVSSITQNAAEVDEELLADVDAQTRNLVDVMTAQVDQARRGDVDPRLAALIPDSFRKNIADTVSNVLAASTLLFGDTPGARLRIKEKKGRRLQSGDDICDVLAAARNNVEGVGNLQTSVVVAGAPQVDVESENVKFAALREDLNEIGGDLSSQLSIPDSGVGNNDIFLPSGLAQELQGLNDNASGDVNIFAAKYGVLIRCEERAVEEVVCTENYLYDGPREGFEGNIVALDFITLDGNANALAVEQIAEPIVLFLDIPESVLGDVVDIEEECEDVVANLNNDSDVREKTIVADEEIQCGFFDEEKQDFITDFCIFVGLEEVNGELKARCECTHATDYAAWNAFKYDVANTLKAQIVLTPLVSLVLFVFFPIVLVFFAVLLGWSYIRDKRDARNILKGALARIKLMRILKARQKRRFFDNIKTAQVETIMKVHDNEMDQSAKLLSSTVQGGSREKQRRKQHRTYLLKQFYLAIKYEHSLFGLSRYDPNFSRVQRSFVFISVVICSFGASALLFELRSDVYAISIGITVAVSLGAAVLVAIPIKFLGRALFKSTENAAGSHQDQVNNMYKIITRVELADGVESETDEQLVEAIHSFYVAEAKFTKVATAAAIQRQNTRNHEKHNDEEKLQVAEVAEVAQVAEAVDEEEELVVAEEYYEAKKALSTATHSARNVWKEAKADSALSGKFYSSWSKIKSVRGQSSTVLKVATVFSGEPSKQARPREARLPLWVLYIDWVFLGLVVGFYSFYSVAFVGTRATRAEEGFPDLLEVDFEPLSEADYITQWALGALGGILISYLVAEPLIALVRYILLPICITRCSKKKPDAEELDTTKLNMKQMDAEKEEKNIRNGYSHLGFDLFADLVENIF